MDRKDFAVLLAAVGIASTSASVACDSSKANTQACGDRSCSKMFIAEKTGGSAKGSEMSCGKGSCGTDAKGAAAAKAKHATKQAAKNAEAKAKVKPAADKAAK